MPLTYDWSNTDLSLDSDDDRTLADAAIYATMGVGINHITEANCLDFFKRVSFYEKVNGAFRNRVNVDTNTVEDAFFTAEEVVRLIGLRTNAGLLTLPQFRKAMWETHDRWNFSYGFKMPLDKSAPVG